MCARARCPFRCTRVLGIRDSGELELARKEFAEHPLHMTNRVLFARPSAPPSIETGMNYSRRYIDMLTHHAKRLYFSARLSLSLSIRSTRKIFIARHSSPTINLAYAI